MSRDSSNKPGPEPERVKVDGDWKDAVALALRKKRPKGGWPRGDDRHDDDLDAVGELEVNSE